jgi:hypothetical protein
MDVIDYNGEGRWSKAEILTRYSAYAAEAGIEPRDLSPHEHFERGRRWVYPVMQEVITGIEAGDPACVRLGIEFIEEDAGFPFGRILKKNTAKALRRAPLSEEQGQRIVRRVVAMLRAGNTPREFREYAKLAREIGIDPRRLVNLTVTNPYVARWIDYLKMAPRETT